MMSTKQLFNTGWFFRKVPIGSGFDTLRAGDDWCAVDIPHDWMIYDANNLYEQAETCYKKTFTITSKEDCLISLRFEGVYMDTTIFLNDDIIFRWPYGYSTFDVDLTPHVKEGENTIYVCGKYQLPNSRWYPGSGIYRNVWLIKKPLTRLAMDGTYISTKQEGDDWNVYIDTECLSESPVTASLAYTLRDENGTIVSNASSEISIDKEAMDSQVLPVPSPKLWDINSPTLYQMTTELFVDGKLYDSIIENIGFRSFSFDPDKGFFLNGRHVKIHGACMHDNLGSLGSAVNKEAIRRQFKSMQEMGVNSIRTAHNMPAVEVMDLADEMGLLIYSESFDMWESCKTDYDYGNFFKDWWEKDLTSWVRRDRNHPSLMIWGIGNEIHDTHYERGIELTKMLRDAVHRLDPRHNGVIGIGSNYIEWENAQKAADEVDISGYNYMEHLYDEHHKKYPHWNIFGSETCSTVQSRGIYHFPASNRLLTFDDLQCSSLGNCTTNWGAKDSMKAITEDRDHEFCFGQYIWSGWDYIGEPTPYFTKNSYFGQVDTAGFPKDTYYVYQAEWTDYKVKPMVHLLPYWDWNEGQLIDIRIYSNAPKTELFFNDKSLGTFLHDHEHGLCASGEWQIPYRKGTLKAVAYDENDKVIATDIQSSFGDPASIKLTPDKTVMKADGCDLIFVTIETEDVDGNYVANSRSRMHVSVTGAGRLIGLDNGDSTDFDQYKGTSRKLFSGKLVAIIAAKDMAGDINISVTSPGLVSAALTLTAIEADIVPGTACVTENTPSEPNNEIPIRKIELTNLGVSHLNSENPTTTVEALIRPASATYSDITFKALTLDGIESNCVKVETEGNTAKITALGDGEFRLCCSATNGKDHPEVISELEFDITGMGTATLNPYGLVSGIQYAESNYDLKLSFQGGVYITSNARTYLTFENVDFGDYGSDEITLPIFSFADEVPVEIWEGHPEKGGTMLLQDTYRAKSWYNHYQDNTFRLSKRLKGTCTVSIVVEPTIKMSIQGFSFTYMEKAYATLSAKENTRITGDTFTIEEDAITGIGNNVTLEYENMDFGEEGLSSITICGHSPIEMNSIHVRFYNDEGDINQIVEFPYSDDYVEKTYPLEPVKGKCKVNFIFLPGSKFDLKWFRFEK